jgi:hypothetical protein
MDFESGGHLPLSRNLRRTLGCRRREAARRDHTGLRIHHAPRTIQARASFDPMTRPVWREWRYVLYVHDLLNHHLAQAARATSALFHNQRSHAAIVGPDVRSPGFRPLWPSASAVPPQLLRRLECNRGGRIRDEVASDTLATGRKMLFQSPRLFLRRCQSSQTRRDGWRGMQHLAPLRLPKRNHTSSLGQMKIHPTRGATGSPWE